MTIRLPNSCFIHVPRTGGLWFKELLERSTIKIQILKGDIDSHFRYKDLPESWQALHSFSFIRHPLTWAFSRWSHLIKHQMLGEGRHEGVHRLFDDLCELTFEATIRNIIEHRPGLTTYTFNEMHDGVKTLIRTEDLPNKAIELIELLEGVKLNTIPEAFNGTSKEYASKFDLSEISKEAFLASEHLLIKQWEELASPLQ